MKKEGLKISTAVGWVFVYFLVMLLYTFLDVALWRTAPQSISGGLHVSAMILCTLGFLFLLKQKTGWDFQLFSKVPIQGIVLALGCSVLFYFLLDKGVDPMLEQMFPVSEQNYQDSINTLAESPVTSFIQVCMIAPVMEELLMRGFVLKGLRGRYGAAAALLVSSVLFALLHFNMVQTLSAFICGMILGLLYLKTESAACCILAHFGYNLISFLAVVIA